MAINSFDCSKRVTLPKDIGPHAISDMEWWYYFTFLNGENGQKYAAMAAFYQAGELPALKGHYLIFSLIDLNRRNINSYSFIDQAMANNALFINLPTYMVQNPGDKATRKLYWSLLQGKLPPPHHWLSNASIKNGRELIYGDSSMIFSNTEVGKFKVKVIEHGTEVNLEFNSQKPVSLIGLNGKPDKLYYYSFTRNNVKGHIKTGSNTIAVTGQGWFDHQWGYLGGLLTKAGWNWFGIQLDDGRELLINEFRKIKSGETFSPMANLIEADGRLKFTRNLSIRPLDIWQSPITNAFYPINWEIIIPEFKMKLKVSAIFDNQEMPVMSPLNAIWEGACKVAGHETKTDLQNAPINGRGFLELVGYANCK